MSVSCDRFRHLWVGRTVMLPVMSHPDWNAADALARVVLQRSDGVAALRAFLDAGLKPRQVAAIFRRRVIERPREGWYVDPELSWQAKHAIRAGGILSCVSAVDSFGVPVPPDAHDMVHVLLPGNAPRVRHNRDRRRYVVPGEDREVKRHWSVHDGTLPGWRTSLIDSLLQLADCVSLDWWIVALDAARHRPRDGEPMLSQEQWDEFVRRVPGRLKRHLDLVDPLSESCLETLLRLGLLRRGIGPLTLQFTPNARHRVDILVGRRLVLEADGAAFHDAEKDRSRDAILRGLGYRVMHFSYDEIVFDLDGVLDRIEAELATM